MKILNGTEEVELTTKTEIVLATALKTVLAHKGDDSIMLDIQKELSFDALTFSTHRPQETGTLQIGTMKDNNKDFVRLLKN